VMASLAEAVAATVIVPETVAPATGEMIATVSAALPVLLTVMDTAALVALFPEVSVATAVKLCWPLVSVVVFKDCEYGAAVTAAPRTKPSTWNCTLATATLSAAVAVIVIVPETVAPEAGEVIETVGGVVSGWVLDWLLELTVPEHPEWIRAKPAISNQPARVIPFVARLNNLARIMIGILDLTLLWPAGLPRKAQVTDSFRPHTYKATDTEAGPKLIRRPDFVQGRRTGQKLHRPRHRPFNPGRARGFEQPHRCDVWGSVGTVLAWTRRSGDDFWLMKHH
jgi:hypothetical protein